MLTAVKPRVILNMVTPPGIDASTGPPLGQGLANAVGMAMAEAHLAAEFNRPGHEIIDHYTYALVTDGDLMEGGLLRKLLH